MASRGQNKDIDDVENTNVESTNETNSQINDVINTTSSIKNNKVDNKLQSEQLKKPLGKTKTPVKKFKCSSVWATLYPDGFQSTYQGRIINLVFDNSVVELTEPVYWYVVHKLQAKADREAYKLNRFKTKKQEKIGEYFEG